MLYVDFAIAGRRAAYLLCWSSSAMSWIYGGLGGKRQPFTVRLRTALCHHPIQPGNLCVLCGAFDAESIFVRFIQTAVRSRFFFAESVGPFFPLWALCVCLPPSRSAALTRSSITRSLACSRKDHFSFCFIPLANTPWVVSSCAVGAAACSVHVGSDIYTSSEWCPYGRRNFECGPDSLTQLVVSGLDCCYLLFIWEQQGSSE